MRRIVVSLSLCFLMILSVVAGVVTAGSSDDWPMFHHDSQHTGYSLSKAPTMDNVMWSYDALDQIQSSPAFGKGRLYVGSHNGFLYCFDADPTEGTDEGIGDPVGSSFDLIWKFTIDGSIRSSPVVYDGKVYFGSDDGKLYCIYACIGTEIWNYSTGAPVSSSPTIVDEKVYVGSENGNVYCIDARNGNHIWQHPTGGPVHSSPAVVNDRVYIGSDDHIVYCFYASNGTELWRYTTDDIVLSS